ncbi:hypothetical protein WMF38_26620 [Sorangium sp. So ce118]
MAPETVSNAAPAAKVTGHTGAALGGETGGNHENRYCFRRPLVIDQLL